MVETSVPSRVSDGGAIALGYSTELDNMKLGKTDLTIRYLPTSHKVSTRNRSQSVGCEEHLQARLLHLHTQEEQGSSSK